MAVDLAALQVGLWAGSGDAAGKSSVAVVALLATIEGGLLGRYEVRDGRLLRKSVDKGLVGLLDADPTSHQAEASVDAASWLKADE
ncbi:MAG: Uncharacterised protein [Prochlorococcus marinus str. MIT 9215]|nr:MAG: Uncharacterised protein [Prochlorococcus marinus str. MIT 9215]